jgi:hypothetical protein
VRILLIGIASVLGFALIVAVSMLVAIAGYMVGAWDLPSRMMAC